MTLLSELGGTAASLPGTSLLLPASGGIARERGALPENTGCIASVWRSSPWGSAIWRAQVWGLRGARLGVWCMLIYALTGRLWTVLFVRAIPTIFF